jgi:hypothetical protein
MTSYGRGVYVKLSPGEALDRLSILQVKDARLCGEKRAASRPAYHCLLRQLEPMLENEDLAALYAQLVDVNGRLWDTEDGVRTAMRRGDDAGFAAHARNVPRQNGERSALKAAIDGLCGCERAEVKDYAPAE